VQVDPIKPTWKAPETIRLKPNHVRLLSNVAFKFNLRLYIEGSGAGGAVCVGAPRRGGGVCGGGGGGVGLIRRYQGRAVCRLSLSNPS
jgi:hypothetical protein